MMPLRVCQLTNAFRKHYVKKEKVLKKKVFFILGLITFLTVCFLFFKNKKQEHLKPIQTDSYQVKKNNALVSHNATKESLNQNNSLPKDDVLRKIQTLCINLKKAEQLKSSDIDDTMQLAKNLHFKKNGHIFRLRIFLEDSEESSYEKLVFYKEDDEGFPRYEKNPKSHERNPSPELIKSYLADSEIIYDEQDIRLTVGEHQIDYTTINSEVVKIASSSLKCFYDKP
jgi:hypothetical protein